jgi:serine/threonine protein kinase
LLHSAILITRFQCDICFFSRLGEQGHICLTDFGLSKEGIIDNSSAHSFCGTPEYLAPEILNRTGHGRAADWWSLGALLYEMLTGMPPFYSRDRERLFQKILTSELQFPRNVSAEAKTLLRGLLCRDPAERLGSGADDAVPIKACAFFADVDFDALAARKLTPPFCPVVTTDEATGIVNTNNVDPDFLGMPLNSAPDGADGASVLSEKAQVSGRFQNFTYVSRSADTAMYVRNEYVFNSDKVGGGDGAAGP